MNYNDSLEILELLDITQESYQLAQAFILSHKTHITGFIFKREVETKFLFEQSIYGNPVIITEHNRTEFIILD